MSIRWDALLVRHTARELSDALVGAELRAVRFDRASRDLVLLFRERTLLWRLHPRHGYLRLHGPLEPVDGDYKLRCRLRSVEAPPDERFVRFEFTPAQAPRALVVELLGNQWNALVTEGESEVIRHVLWRRGGVRSRVVGQPYGPPIPLGRAGVDGGLSVEDWIEALGPLPLEERPKELVRTFAWTSPLNASALLGTPDEAGGASELDSAYERWREMTSAEASPDPVILDLEAGLQPYPFPLAGTPHRAAESLLAAFEACAAHDTAAGQAPAASALGPSVVARLERAVRLAARRVTRLELELAGLEDPDTLRVIADLILARYAEIPAGADVARLTGFDDAEVEVRLDPADPPHANASRYYRKAAKVERARMRLPGLQEDAQAACSELEELLARVREGTASEAEVREALGPLPPGIPAQDAEPSLPYRTFTSSGGLEIRVGRGARHNDDVTFRHSSPGDVWLHARHGAGAHVILRWPGPGKPPARDLKEAATLAALHSKARTSGSVPVDWTLRKYVRKPRKAPPGRVVAERVETLFVEPDPSLMDSLAPKGTRRPAPP